VKIDRLSIGTTLVAAAASLVSGCGRREAQEAASAATTIAVTVQAARIDTIRDTVVVPGQVVPSAAAEQIVTAPEPAELVEAPKAEGDAVQPGDLLARFEIASITTEVQARQIELAEATLKYETARAEATRQSSLSDRGLISRNALDASKSALAAAEAALGQAKTHVETAKSAQERTLVRARFPGIVSKVLHRPGEIVTGGTGDPVLRVIDPTRLQIAAQVPLASFERILPTQPAVIQADTGATEASAVALRLAPAVGSSTGEVRLHMPSPTTLKLDTAVQVQLLLEERRDVIVVPQQAIQRDGTTTYVWIAGDDRQAHRRDVRTGLASGSLIQVVTGVAAGEHVILTGITELAEGTPISFRTAAG
jgi:RND family efflux transporter MFP subunit